MTMRLDQLWREMGLAGLWAADSACPLRTEVMACSSDPFGLGLSVFSPEWGKPEQLQVARVGAAGWGQCSGLPVATPPSLYLNKVALPGTPSYGARWMLFLKISGFSGAWNYPNSLGFLDFIAFFTYVIMTWIRASYIIFGQSIKWKYAGMSGKRVCSKSGKNLRERY